MVLTAPCAPPPFLSCAAFLRCWPWGLPSFPAASTFGGSDALALTEHLDGTDYVTILYCLDGQLRELYTEAGSGLLPEDGIPVLDLQSLTLSSEDGLLTLTVTAPNGERATVSLSPRCGLREEVGAL